MFGIYFGKYLLDEGVLTEDQYGRIMSEVRQGRKKLGQMANAEGYMTNGQAEEINHLQLRSDEKFGELAVERGYLDEEQLDELLEKQEETYLLFVKILIGEYNFSLEDLQKHVNNFKRNENYTASELDALKTNNVDKVMEIFTKNESIPDIIRNYIDVMGKNIMRFTENNVRFEAMETVKQYASASVVFQKIVGDYHIYTGICAGSYAGGLDRLAKTFADNMDMNVQENDVMNVISRFLNITNSLFIKKERANNVIMQKDRLKSYEDMVSLTAEGNIYVMPFYITGERVDIVLNMDTGFQIS